MRTKYGINVDRVGHLSPQRYEGLKPQKCAVCGKGARRLVSRTRAYIEPQTNSIAGFLCDSCWVERAVAAVASAVSEFPGNKRPRILGRVVS